MLLVEHDQASTEKIATKQIIYLNNIETIKDVRTAFYAVRTSFQFVSMFH